MPHVRVRRLLRKRLILLRWRHDAPRGGGRGGVVGGRLCSMGSNRIVRVGSIHIDIPTRFPVQVPDSLLLSHVVLLRNLAVWASQFSFDLLDLLPNLPPLVRVVFVAPGDACALEEGEKSGCDG